MVDRNWLYCWRLDPDLPALTCSFDRSIALDIPGDKGDISGGDFFPANGAIRQMPFDPSPFFVGAGIPHIADQILTEKVLHKRDYSRSAGHKKCHYIPVKSGVYDCSHLLNAFHFCREQTDSKRLTVLAVAPARMWYTSTGPLNQTNRAAS
jgi:hypothetical protein